MTPTAPHPALDLYLQHPLEDGAAVLLLDGSVCLELSGRPALDEAVLLAAGACSTVLLAVARTGLRPRGTDLLLWAELCAAVEAAGTRLLPLAVLPAAPAW